MQSIGYMRVDGGDHEAGARTRHQHVDARNPGRGEGPSSDLDARANHRLLIDSVTFREGRIDEHLIEWL